MKKVFINSTYYIAILILLINNSYAASKIEKYTLQERCKKSADDWFQKEWGGKQINSDKDWTTIVNYECHYNKKLNKCFLLFTTISLPKNKKDNKIDMYVLFDINGNKEYGSYYKIQNASGYGNVLDIKSSVKVECTSKGDWDLLVRPYMEE